ncbi:hypothetical protein RHGRI_005547 [Rhododendron griersonianum]|uniref:DUF8039 domain-containing protein n=1 Tax=Rhododendron griersonianum TaxID=479676 RepID=A0AAV6LFK8_9ERIC|nr:hypothetical protein RHGRI_005547 [Rhododendron griersonianum]
MPKHLPKQNNLRTKSDFPQPNPNPTGKKSKQCKLAVGSIENIVAHGRMYERVSSDETIHTLPLGELNVRVYVDFVIIPHALLPIPIPGDATSVGEAVGYELAWPKNLVLVNDEGASKHLPKQANKFGGKMIYTKTEIDETRVEWINCIFSRSQSARSRRGRHRWEGLRDGGKGRAQILEGMAGEGLGDGGNGRALFLEAMDGDTGKREREELCFFHLCQGVYGTQIGGTLWFGAIMKGRKVKTHFCPSNTDMHITCSVLPSGH